MPATVQAILAARIDRLRPELKRLLQAAAVVGKDVPVALLAAVAEMDGRRAARRRSRELQTAEFLYEARLFPDLEYTFKHALTHEVAYGGVLQERRRALHAAILETRSSACTPTASASTSRCSRTTRCGRRVPRQGRPLPARGGAKAVARSANREAVDFFERALALLAELPETPRDAVRGPRHAHRARHCP